MQLKLDLQDGTPLYQQIVEQVKYLVAGGRMKPGDAVPPIRALAEQLRINPNTVARAYMELERGGVLVMRQGFGTTIAPANAAVPHREKLKLLAKPADSLLTDARHLSVGLDEVIGLVRERDALLNLQSPK